MARLIEIKNPDHSLCVEIAPDNGGMITQIQVNGKEILYLDRAALEMNPMTAGGIPVLFPFASKTKNDCYEWNEKNYGMPMHGLIKNAAFGIKDVAENRITLWIENNPCWYQDQYPFEFHFEVTYEICENRIRLEAAIENQSASPMPHYFGWHPYFRASDKHKLILNHPMTVHYDYTNCVDFRAPIEMDLSERWDDVFHTPKSNEFLLRNMEDGYEVRCTSGHGFEALVVCTWVEDCVCIEPWCGIPDSIHNGRFIKWIEAGKTECYEIFLDISTF